MFVLFAMVNSVALADLHLHLNMWFEVGVVPTTAGEQKVIDTWDLTSLDGAWRLLFKLNI